MAVKMGHLFISYSHKDKAYARKLAEALKTRGFNAWIDDSIDYGTSWPDEIEKRLDDCDAFIVIVSKNSSKSSWVQNEVARASRKGKTIFPLLLSGEVWLSLEARQYVDVKNKSLPPEQFYDRLRLAIRGSGLPPPPPEETEPKLDDGKKKGRPILEVTIGQILRVVVFFTFAAFAIFLSIRYIPQNPPATPTPAPLAPTWTAEVISPIKTPLVIVDTSNLTGWVPDFNRANDDQAKNKIAAFENAISLIYTLGENGYVIITKRFDPIKLSGTEGISFMYKGVGAANTIEFKLLLRYPGDTDDTTYGILLPGATNTADQWREVQIRYRDMQCWWPAGNCAAHGDLLDVTMVDRLDFVVSNKPGDDPGSGWIMIKDVFGIVP